ncbi:MAG: sialate O-acetylesterase [Verrucomicrobia bacterium]|nr:sialate O-acetylesterase [Verrucomicrobiota bacterium]
MQACSRFFPGFQPALVAGFIGVVLAAVAPRGLADVRLPALFSDHMVLQRGIPIKVWGWADEGESVTVEFRGQRVVAAPGVGGRWDATLKSASAGGPFVLAVTGRNRVEVKDVLVGEVWLCSGQSNMEWPLSASAAPEADIASAGNPNLRLFTVPKLKAREPVADVKASWQLCSPATVPGFSAVGFYFGRALQTALKVPVGMIHTSWGGSPAEVWMSEHVLRGDEEYRRQIVDTYAGSLARYREALAEWEREKADAEAAGKRFEKGRPREPWRPSELYNGMIAPLVPFAVKGAIWYQGESNAGRAWQYRRLYADLIENWRRDWNQPDFYFLGVQLAPWDRNKNRNVAQILSDPVASDWAELREAQGIVAKRLKGVGHAVITDVGHKDDIHPPQKRPVGERLALAARVIAYQQRIHGLSPEFESATFKNGKAVLRFANVGRGLVVRGDRLVGFVIAGPDQKFVRAEARLVGNQVVVSHPDVPEPVAVRFGWADYPIVNLFSADGLPVSPFRTDDWPLLTQPKP